MESKENAKMLKITILCLFLCLETLQMHFIFGSCFGSKSLEPAEDSTNVINSPKCVLFSIINTSNKNAIRFEGSQTPNSTEKVDLSDIDIFLKENIPESEYCKIYLQKTENEIPILFELSTSSITTGKLIDEKGVESAATVPSYFDLVDFCMSKNDNPRNCILSSIFTDPGTFSMANFYFTFIEKINTKFSEVK